MLGDTITIAINAVNKTLVKINQDGYSSEYQLRETNSIWNLKIRHTKDTVPAGAKPRDRHFVTLTETVLNADPAIPAFDRVTQITMASNKDDAYLNQAYDALGLFGALPSATLQKIFGWES